MKFTTLFICLITLSLLYTSCTQSVDNTTTKTNTKKVTEPLLEESQTEAESQVDSTSTLASNEVENNTEMEMEMEAEAIQPEEEKEAIEKQSQASNTTTLTPIEPSLSEAYVKEEKSEQPKENAAPASSPKTKQPKTSKPKSEPKPKPKPEKKASPLASYFQATNQFLNQYVSGGLIAYSKIKKNTIAPLIEQIATADLSQSNSTEKQAFYINSYNLLVIKSLIDNGTPSSPLDVLGFFDAKKHKVAGQSITLDQLEKGKLFGLKKDPRFHFVAVCGAKGCPQIEPFAYSPSNLNAQLNRQTKKAINNPNFIRVKDDEQKVELSEIFKWYAGDFTQGGKSVLDYINQYRNTPIPTSYQVGYYPYDWKINKK